jgi:succinate-semialdehyde dehydrogenase/glutarate-semialdehyde dehydrogenase
LATDVVGRVTASVRGRSTFEIRDPATGSVITEIDDHDADDAMVAVDRPRAGAEWARTSPRLRADVLRAWFNLLTEHAEELAALITREMGKPLAEARAEVAYGTDFVRWYSEEATRPAGNMREVPAGGAQLLTRRAPVGLSVLITPWNFPLAMATRPGARNPPEPTPSRRAWRLPETTRGRRRRCQG